jgi:hypothetical protein
MPRPKVKPENRKRSICACIPCKTSKIRCDAADPCGPCSKRERAGSCVYPANNRSTGPRKRRRLSTASGPVETDDSLPNASLLSQDNDADGQRARRDEAVEGGMSNSSDASESDEPVSCQTEGRMLFNSKGEKCTCRWFLYRLAMLTINSIRWGECFAVISAVSSQLCPSIDGAVFLYRASMER